ncbi:hypothetical protein B296_00042149 [Ensete ventricosum]|uniref:Uncharacterized protein n=1 Tax=Ensete ventricosum TaxID=4639 RepID=A0A426YWB2_ENSVE|nr:hypothetical protein B296_00042149 [Ensete ventricosum]
MDTYFASELEEDAQRREDDGKEDVDAVGRALVRHYLDSFSLSKGPKKKWMRQKKKLQSLFIDLNCTCKSRALVCASHLRVGFASLFGSLSFTSDE